MRLLIACLLVATLAGCSEPVAAPTPTEPVGDGNQTAQPPIVAAAPVARLSADVVNGTAPLNVTFGLDGSAQGSLSWTLTIAGAAAANGTELPASYSHTFPAGNFSIALEVRHGNASHVAWLNVTSLAADVPAPEAPEPYMIQGSILLPASGAAAGEYCYVAWVESGVDGASYGLDRNVDGWSFTLTPGFWAYWWDSGNEVDLGNSGSSGTVPDGAAYVDVCADLPDEGDFELVMTAP